jgi:tRNA threonylcarbamoyladenosine biosynthesis protein TsaE
MQEIKTASPEETEALGEKIGQTLRGGEVLALFGGMGMGKTAFARGLARGLRVTGEVSSPTFALVHEYTGALTMYHFDMYRVTGWDDLYSTGFFDYLESGGVLLIEWSENIENALPENAAKIWVRRGLGENERIFTFERDMLP